MTWRQLPKLNLIVVYNHTHTKFVTTCFTVWNTNICQERYVSETVAGLYLLGTVGVALECRTGRFGVHGGFTDRSLVFSAWQEVLQQEQEVGQAAQKAVHYKEATPSPHMDDFVPIDLDEWWAQRFLENIDKLS